MDIRLTIDGKSVTVPKGTPVIEAAKKIGIKIPALCYDKNLQIVSSCRLCLVEVEGDRKLQTSCSLLVREGMVVHTMTDRLVRIRKGLLRLLLDNHPNDCLTCQKAGDCLLQQYAYEYDVAFRTHDGARRGTEEARFTDTSSPFILRDESKCILCGKCVRTCGEILDRQVLNFAGRGFDTHISADADQTLEESTCVSCNRCVTVCPVGALIDRPAYEARLREWQGTKKGVKCRACDYGCNMEVHKVGNRVAVRAKDPASGRPLCLRGRLFTMAEHMKNLPKYTYKKVETPEGRRFVQTSWQEALSLDQVLANLPDPDDE